MKRLAVLAMTAFFVAAPPALAVRDFAGTALNIIPSGQYGGVPPPPKADQQARMYDGLTPLFGDVRPHDLTRYFKSEKLGIKSQGRMKRERVPHGGVRLFRDKFNVPHIYGKTNDDVTWAAGWVLAQDRELLLEQARYNSRVAVIDAPGLSAIGLVVGLKTFQPSRQTERELAKEVTILKRRYGKGGRQLIHDMRVYVKGINAYYRKKLPAASRPKPWTILDVIALNAIKSQLFGQGGGKEVAGRAAPRRAAGLSSAPTRATRSGTTCASARTRRRPSRSRATSRTRRCPAQRTGNVVLDNGSFQRVPEPGVTAAARDEFTRAHEQRADGRRQAVEVGPPAVRRRPADRLLLPRPDARDGPARARLERARRHRPGRSPATS